MLVTVLLQKLAMHLNHKETRSSAQACASYRDEELQTLEIAPILDVSRQVPVDLGLPEGDVVVQTLVLIYRIK